MTSFTVSSKRDMCAPFCFGPRSTKHSRRAEKSCSWPPWRRRTIFSTPVTPTRERLTCTAGSWFCTSGEARLVSMTSKPSFGRKDDPRRLEPPEDRAINHELRADPLDDQLPPARWIPLKQHGRRADTEGR